jgi:membrane protein implicated in regulation of membrane protease activity
MDLPTISIEVIWLILGIIFVFSEFFVPGLVIAFFGVGGFITAITTWLNITTSFPAQLLTFMLSSLVLLFSLRRFLKPVFFGETQDSSDNQFFNIEIGKTVPVVELIEPEQLGGKVRYQGAPWSAKADERIAPGESARIIGCDNLTLIVEKVGKKEQ